MLKQKLLNQQFIGRILLLLLLLYFSNTLLRAPIPWIFLDNINLPVHEAGHFMFSSFGDVIRTLGGTILQLLVPLTFLTYFWRGKVWDGLLFSSFWIGNNLINIGVYMKDAQVRQLPLVGNGSHDWNWLFTHWGVLESSVTYGLFIIALGKLLVLVSIGVLIYLIYKDTFRLKV